MSQVERILAYKVKLLKPRNGDKFTLPFYLDGWRECNIKLGYKWGTVKPLFGTTATKRYSVSSLKQELKNLYWYAARCDASREAFEEGRPKRKRGWEKSYA